MKLAAIAKPRKHAIAVVNVGFAVVAVLARGKVAKLKTSPIALSVAIGSCGLTVRNIGGAKFAELVKERKLRVDQLATNKHSQG